MSITSLLQVTLLKKNALVLQSKFKTVPYNQLSSSAKEDRNYYLAAFNANIISLGFILSEDAYNHLKYEDFNFDLLKEIIDTLKTKVGANVVYEPMYPNFPLQVMDMDEFELYTNAIQHYWSTGIWKPSTTKNVRSYYQERNNLKVIDLITQTEAKGIYKEIITSNDSLTPLDKEILDFFHEDIDEYLFENNELIVDKIPHKEVLAYILKALYDYYGGFTIGLNNHFNILINNVTDILRMIVAINNGDVSLSAPTKFKSMKRNERKFFLKLIEDRINEEDIQRHRNVWVKLFHMLHVGDYYKKFPKSYKIASYIRDGHSLNTIMQRYHVYINQDRFLDAAILLSNIPGQFARSLDFLLRNIEPNKESQLKVVELFGQVANRISTRVLMQLYGHFHGRNEDIQRIVFPKSSSSVILLDSNKQKINQDILDELRVEIEYAVHKRFEQMDALGSCYIDERLKNCPLPSQMRSTSKNCNVVARGTHLQLGVNKDYLRFFIYWIGQDIDLSIIMHDENGDFRETCSYYHLKNDNLGSYHSGDITNAKNGASEFIDINIPKCLENGIRYISMNVMVYNGPTFKEHKKVYAGWMERESANSNEIYEPSTVKMKLDLTSNSMNSIPVVFDLLSMEAIYLDLSYPNKIYHGGNNVASNMKNVCNIVKAMINISGKPTLYDLFTIHAWARGYVTEYKEEAETIFSLDEGITPYMVSEINSKWIV